MVFFTCNHCGESVKKPSVEKHYQRKCGQPIFVSCMDCLKDFRGDEYAAHTKCITEAEKYSGKDYVPKESKNTGLKKQESWLEIVRSILSTEEYNLSPAVKGVFQKLQSYENVPRKKVKFQNFVTNCMRLHKNQAEAVWNILEKALEKFKELRTNIVAEKNEKNVDVEEKPANGNKEENEVNEIKKIENVEIENGKKSKKDKKKSIQNDEIIGISETHEDENKSKKKKRKQLENGENEKELAAEIKKVSEEISPENGVIPKTNKKLKKKQNLETSEIIDISEESSPKESKISKQDNLLQKTDEGEKPAIGNQEGNELNETKKIENVEIENGKKSKKDKKKSIQNDEIIDISETHEDENKSKKKKRKQLENGDNENGLAIKIKKVPEEISPENGILHEKNGVLPKNDKKSKKKRNLETTEIIEISEESSPKTAEVLKENGVIEDKKSKKKRSLETTEITEISEESSPKAAEVLKENGVIEDKKSKKKRNLETTEITEISEESSPKTAEVLKENGVIEDKKSKKKRSLETTEITEISEESLPKKSKISEQDNLLQNIENGNSEKSPKKKFTENGVNKRQSIYGKTNQFDWTETIFTIIGKNDNTISVDKLEKKVLKKFKEHAKIDEIPYKIKKTFNKKLRKSGLIIKDDIVKMIS